MGKGFRYDELLPGARVRPPPLIDRWSFAHPFVLLDGIFHLSKVLQLWYNRHMQTITCHTCQQPFVIHNTRILTAKYCSRACYARAFPPATLVCQTCGKSFVVVGSRNVSGRQAKYCSRACRDFRRLFPCVVCGTAVLRTRSEMKTRRYVYCSVECERVYHRESLSGVNHPRFLNSLALPAFSDAQQEMILGTVLGDGCLLLNSNGNAHLQVAHSVKQHAYLEYKQGLLAPFASAINIHRRLDPRYARTYETHRFTTQCHPWLTALREELYIDGTKHLPASVLPRITPRALAFWYMDDGGCSMQSTFSICTVSFPPAEVAEAARALAVLDLRAWERQGRLFISAHCKYTLLNVIGPFVPESMRYKLGSADRHPRLL